jgi:hypothetical protein
MLIFSPLFTACTDVGSTGEHQKSTFLMPNMTPNDLDWDFIFAKDIVISDNKTYLEEIYEKNAFILQYYQTKRIQPPPTDFNQDLSNLSYTELRRLRHSIYAKNGYLTMDFTLRAYFEKNCDWYQPVYDVEDFKLHLTQQEYDFTVKIFEKEKVRYAELVKKVGGYNLYDPNSAQNISHFELDTEALKALREQNFFIVPASESQLYHVYDNNYYAYIPNFVTTDAVQQILQKNTSKMLHKLELLRFNKWIKETAEALHQETEKMYLNANDAEIKKAAAWANAYATIAYSLSMNKKIAPADAAYANVCAKEFKKITMGKGEGSEFLSDPLLQYSIFIPRGDYTLEDTLENYFRTVKWLNSSSFPATEDSELLAVVAMSKALEQNEKGLKSYELFSKSVGLFAGGEDNLSLLHVLKATKDKRIEQLNNPDALKKLRKDLEKLNPDRIRTVSTDNDTQDYLKKMRIQFTAGRYTFDAEIFTKMVHILSPKPKRTFPKGLDVFAAAGNKTAEDILLNHYKEGEKWLAYKDSLEKSKKIFSDFKAWNSSFYNKSFESLLTLQQPEEENAPLYARTNTWEKRKLITALSAWAQLKHNLTLYLEGPKGAQAGQGGGPPPPHHLGYVEPNVRFWKKALELIDLQEKTLFEMGVLDESENSDEDLYYNVVSASFTHRTLYIHRKLRGMIEKLLVISEKELKGAKLTNEDFVFINYIGGEMENLLFLITDCMAGEDLTTALTTDVYRYNGEHLQASVGFGDIIYVIAEINGLPYLTKGAVFSYYEFTSSSPLTNKEWENTLRTKAPPRPSWQKELFIQAKSVKDLPISYR